MSDWQFTHVRVQVASSRYASNVLALLLLPVLCAVGLLGNLLVCLAIWFDRRLHNVTNYFLFSLALADLLVCSVVMPLSLLVEVRHGVWTWSFSVCLLYVYSDVFLCTASIVHMSIISLDRFLGISKPLKTRHQSRSITALKIVFVWVITVLISCPIAVAAILDPSNILQHNSCLISNRYYMVYGSTFAFLIPFVIMLVTYIKTTGLLKKQASQLSQRSNARSNGLRRTMPPRRLHHVTTVNGSLRKGGANAGSFSSLRVAAPPLLADDQMHLIAIPLDGKNNKDDKSALCRLRESTLSAMYALAARLNRRNSLHTTSQELANEDKATRVLAVVFGCFFVCWTPFFAANFAVGFCGDKCAVPQGVASLFLWLGYVSSTVNPLIYTIFNRRFRQAFIRIIRCQCFHPWREAGSGYSRNNTCLAADTYTWSNGERVAGVRTSEYYWGGGSSWNNSVNERRRAEAKPLLWSKNYGSASAHDNLYHQSPTLSNQRKYLNKQQRMDTAVHTSTLPRRATNDRCTQTAAASLVSEDSSTSPDSTRCSPTSLFIGALFADSMPETFL